MADNVTVDNGSGTDYTVSTDDAGAAGQVQRVKLAYSADGSATHVQADADGVLVNLGANNDVTVTGTVTADAGSGTFAVSAASLPLPTGAATAAKQPALGTAGTPSADVISVQGVSGGTALPVSDGGGSLTVDATSLPLPTGASTAANQTTIIGHLDGVEGLLTTIDADTSALAGAVAGTEVQVDIVAALPTGANTIGNIGTIATSVTPGTGASNLGKAEDAAHTTGDVGVMALAVRQDTASALAGTNGDYAPLEVDASGRLHVNVGALPASTNTIEVVGDAAEDAALAGNPIRVGMRASNADPTAMSADGDVVTPAADRKGQQYMLPGRAATATLSNVSSSATSTSILASNTSRKGVIIYNDSTQVLYLKYGSTASSSSFTYYIAAGAHWEMPSPIFTGALDGIWASANGNARVTEMSG